VLRMPEPVLLDQFIPRYDHSVVYSQVFRALPEKCFEALVDMRAFHRPWLFWLVGKLTFGCADAIRSR